MTKTNAMRKLDQAKISYEALEYDWDEDHLGGEHAAQQVGLPESQVFKTLVARGEKKGIVVFCIPVNQELDLKKAAVATGEKKVELVAVKDLLGLTGYVRGGCSPIGMKKSYPVFLDDSANKLDKIAISAGTRGCQLYINREAFVNYIHATLCQLTKA